MPRRNYPTESNPTSPESTSLQQQQHESSSSSATAALAPAAAASSSSSLGIIPKRNNNTGSQNNTSSLQFAEQILQAAGGCPTLRRSVFQYLDRFEALKLSDASPSWREASSHPASWLPMFLSYAQPSKSGFMMRSVTVATRNEHDHNNSNSNNTTDTANSSRSNNNNNKSPNRTHLSPSDAGLAKNSNNTSSSSSSYNPPQTTPDTSLLNNNSSSQSMMFAPLARQLVAKAAFPQDIMPVIFQDGGGGGGSSSSNNNRNRNKMLAKNNDNVDSGNTSYNNVIASTNFASLESGIDLEKLWDLKHPEIFFSVAEIFRKPPREMAAVLEYCDKMISVVNQSQYSNLNMNSPIIAVQTQLFLAIELLCNPLPNTTWNRLFANNPDFQPEKKRFMTVFPAICVLLRCPALLNVASLEMKVPASLLSTINNPQVFVAAPSEEQQQQGNTSAYEKQVKRKGALSRNLSPVVLLFSEICKWHDADPCRENAPWFSTLASWSASVPQQMFTDISFHPVFLLPHVLCLKSLSLAVNAADVVINNNSNNNNDNRSKSPTSNNASFSNNNNNFEVSSTSSAPITMEMEEWRDSVAIRAMLRKNLDAAQCVKIVVQSAADTALRQYNIQNKRGSIGVVMAAKREEQRELEEEPAAVSNNNGDEENSNTNANSSSTEKREQMQMKESLGGGKKNIHNGNYCDFCFNTLAKLEQLIRTEVVYSNEEKTNDEMRKSCRNIVQQEVENVFVEVDGTGEIGIGLLEKARKRRGGSGR